MKMLELADLLYSLDSEEVFIVNAEGQSCEIEIEEREEVFDGWDTVYPKHIALKPKINLNGE